MKRAKPITPDDHADMLALSRLCTTWELSELFDQPTHVIRAALRDAGAQPGRRHPRRNDEQETERQALMGRVRARRTSPPAATPMAPTSPAVARGMPAVPNFGDRDATVSRSVGRRPLPLVAPALPAPVERPLPPRVAPLPAARVEATLVPPVRAELPPVASSPPARPQPLPPLARRHPTPKGERRSRVDPFADLVGLRSDAEVARLAGVRRETVIAYRQTRGIPAPPIVRSVATKTPRRKPSPVKPCPSPVVEPTASTEPPRTPTGRNLRRSKLDAFRHLLGTIPDHEVALLANMNRQSVMEYRRARGIPAAGRLAASALVGPDAGTVGAAAEPVEEPSPAVRPSNQSQAPAPAARTKPTESSFLLPGELDASPPRPVAPRIGRPSKLAAHRDLIGALPDAEVAARAGVAVERVRDVRRSLGIAEVKPLYGSPRRPGRQSKILAHAHLIGVEPDEVVAALAGVTSAGIRGYRWTRGIAAPKRADVAVASGDGSHGGADPAGPTATSAQKGSAIRPASSISVLEAHREIIGGVPDVEVAFRAGVSPRAVLQFRQRWGIPAAPRPFPPPKEPPPQKPRPPSPVDPYRAQLGVLSDAEIAEMAGVRTGLVRAYRARLGTPRAPAWAGRGYKPNRGAAVIPPRAETPVRTPAGAPPPSRGAPIPAPPVGPNGRLITRGYYVLAERDGVEVRHVVLAADMSEAMRTAMRSLVQDAGWRIVRTWDAGEVLAGEPPS